MDLAVFNVLDGRRYEVVAHELTLFRGAQLATDTTLVPPLHRDDTARRRAGDVDGAALVSRSGLIRKFSGNEGRDRLVVVGR